VRRLRFQSLWRRSEPPDVGSYNFKTRSERITKNPLQQLCSGLGGRPGKLFIVRWLFGIISLTLVASDAELFHQFVKRGAADA